MKISILCFSQTGWKTGMQIVEGMNIPGMEISLDGKSRHIPGSITESHREWTGRQFRQADALIFIGACGIAVRSIAPFVKTKKNDPAVIVIDECGKFAISLLSGHLGGANELTEKIADILGATAVITTATDLHKLFAVDMFAKKNQCEILPLKAAKEVSAGLLNGETTGFYSDFPWEGRIPEELCECDKNGLTADGRKPDIGIAVTVDRRCKPFPTTVYVIPKTVVLGIGCRKGKEFKEIQNAVQNCLKERGIFQQALKSMASIDLKKEEHGLLLFAKEWKLSFDTFSEKQLENAAGNFTKSDFVKSVTGIDNVCERSAVIASRQGKLIQRKIISDGVTTALALKDWRVHFE